MFIVLMEWQISDPACDPMKPLDLPFSEISVAQHKIQSGIVRTNCRRSRLLSKMFDMDLFLKMEVNQDTGSFKERGARNALMNLTDAEKANGVFAASAGNHALALSMHGMKLGVKINVVMPKVAPIMKINRCEELGANIIIAVDVAVGAQNDVDFFQGDDVGASREVALRLAKEKGGTYINGYDHIDILAGAGTIGLEIVDQVNDIDAVLVPVGGCGLIAGVAVAVKTLSPSTKVIGIVTETCPALIKSLQSGRPVYTPTHPTLADGLAVPSIGVNAFKTLHGKVDDVISVPENDIAIAILRLLEYEKVVCEGAGAIGIAALLSGKLDNLKGKKVVSILSGGNIDSTALGRCIERGLYYDHRVVRFTVVLQDAPGGLTDLCRVIGDCGASIKDIYMERSFNRNDMSSIRVKVVSETRGLDHLKQLRKVLFEKYTAERCNFLELREEDKTTNGSEVTK